MRNQIKIVLGLAALALSLGARVGLADTVSVQNLSQDTADGVFQYTISLSSSGEFQSGDGFTIYDFPGLISYSISGLKQSDYQVNQTLTSNTLNDPSEVDVTANAAATSNSVPFDDPTIENLSFVDIRPGTLTGPRTGILTLYTSVLGGDTASVFGAVDNSTDFDIDNPLEFSAGEILVPMAGTNLAIGVPEISAGSLVSLAIVLFGTFALMEGRKSKSVVA